MEAFTLKELLAGRAMVEAMKSIQICGATVSAILYCSAVGAAADTERASRAGLDTFETFKARHVVKWQSYGIGKIASDHGQVLMSEAEGSKGIMLISPERYCGDTIVRFDVQPLLPATVLVTNLATQDVGRGSLTFPSDYDGQVDYMFDHLSMYNFIYHAAAHNRSGPFLRRFPDIDKSLLSPASEHYMQVGKYSAVEIGRIENRVWLSIDGRDVVEWFDPAPLPGGHVVLRLRGTAHERGAALFRNLRIANDRGNSDCY